ncbi:hypothetical protein [Ehrlichia muris]|uniref:hypothetical protein n=1 Tax=Ehrlichia muris TaxID=35795 RepID=UPI0037C199AE
MYIFNYCLYNGCKAEPLDGSAFFGFWVKFNNNKTRLKIPKKQFMIQCFIVLKLVMDISGIELVYTLKV